MPADVRQRILDTATKLFYEEGIQNVGVDRIVKESAVAKMSLYKHFGSKNELIAEFLRCSHDDWKAWFTQAVECHSGSLTLRTVAFFRALDEWIRRPEFRGCPFINSVVELADAGHPGAAATQEHRAFIRVFLKQQIALDGVLATDELVEQLFILMDGAVIGAMMGNPDAARLASKVAACLLEEGGAD